MIKKIPRLRVLFSHCIRQGRVLVSGVFLLAMLGASLATVLYPRTTSADTNNYLNFQARLQTASGAIVPDGDYNIQFKLYDVSSSGSALWTESWYDSNGATAGNDNRLRVKNGYFSANLGALTSFPGTINWDQQLWITMNVGGSAQTSSPSYDGEMNPRLKLTGIPYAFRAGELAKYNSSTGFTGVLQLQATTGGNQTFVIPDQGAAGTYTLLTSGAADGSYIQNQNSTNQSADFRISGTGRANTSLLTPLLDTPTAATLNIGTTNATSISLNQNTSIASNKSFTANGTALFKSATNGSTVFGVQNANGDDLFNIDSADSIITIGSDGAPASVVIKGDQGITLDVSSDAASNLAGRIVNTFWGGGIEIGDAGGTALRVIGPGGTPDTLATFTNTGKLGIGTDTPGYALDVVGDINTSTGYRVGGTAGATTTCSGGQFLQNAVIAGGIVTGGSCATATAGVTTVGTIDSQTKSANGAVISGTSIYLQTADATSPGLVSTGTQTFAGAKTFNGAITASGGISGDGSGLTSLNASNISSGTLGTGRLSGSYTGITGTGALAAGSIVSGFGTISTGNTIATTSTITGATVNATTKYQINGVDGLSATCSGGQFLQNATSAGGIVTAGTCATPTDTGVTTVGTIDSQTKSANGAVISGTSIYLQTADASNPGLVSTGTQTIAGAKTFSGNTAVSGSSTLTVGGNLFGGANAYIGTTSVPGGVSNGRITAISGSTTQITGVFRAIASQTVDILQLQDSAGACLWRVSQAGTTGSCDTSSAASGNSTFRTGDTSAASSNSGTLTLRSGNSSTSGNSGTVNINSGSATSGNSGNVSIDAGTASGTVGTVGIGVANTNQISLGRASTSNTSISLTGQVSSKVVSDITNAFQVLNAAGYRVLNVDTSAAKVMLGNVTSTSGQGVAGTLVLADGTNDNFGLSLVTTTLTGNRTITLPNETGTVCTTGSVCTGYAASSGSANYIQNGTSPQTADFNITGNATIGGSLTIGGVTQNGSFSFSGNASSSVSTSSGILTLQGGNSIIKITASSGDIDLLPAAGTGGGTGTLTLGNSNSGTINLGALSNNARTINIGVGTGGSQAQTVNVGSSGGASVVNIAAGTGNINAMTANLVTPNGGFGRYQNLLTYSEQFDNAAWTKTNVTAPTADTIVSPDGQNSTAESLSDSSSGGSVSQSTSTAKTNNTYTFSVWLKTTSGNTQTVDLRVDGTGSGTGSKVTVTATSTWQRFSVSQNPNAFTGNLKVMIFPGGTAGSNSNAVHAWGAQLELASSPGVYAQTVASTFSTTGTGFLATGQNVFRNAVDGTTAFLVQNAAGNNYIAVDTSTPKLSLGDTGIVGTVQIGNTTGAVTQTINVGNNATASSITNVTIGSTIGTSSTVLQGGTNSISIASGGIIVDRSSGNPTIATNSGTSSTKTLVLASGAVTGGSAQTTGAVAISSGDGSGTNTSSGIVSIDSGTKTGSGTSGAVSIGTSNAPTVNIANNDSAHTINIANGGSSTAQAVNVGSTSSTSNVAIQGGNGATAITLQTASGGTVSIGSAGVAGTIQLGNTTGAVAQTINVGNNATASSTTTTVVGSTVGSSTTTIQGGTGNVNLLTNSASASIIAKSSTNSGTAFQVVDSANKAYLNVDTASGFVINNGVETAGNLLENPGFEAGVTTTNASGWAFPGTYSIATSAANAHSGNKVLTATGTSVTVDAATTKTYAVQPGDTYYVEGWVKSASANGTGGFYTAQYDKDVANGTVTAVGGSYIAAPGSTYTRISAAVTIASGKYYLTVSSTVRSDSTTGTWYFDDLVLQRTNTGTPMTVQSASDSASLFQVQNASGSQAFVVDTTSTNSNLISNPDFENASTSGATVKGTGSLTFSTAQKQYGSYSLTTTTGAFTGQGIYFNGFTQTVAAGTYTFSFDMRLSSGTWIGTNIGVGYTTVSDNNACTFTSPAEDALTTGFRRYSCTFTAGATVTKVYIYQVDSNSSTPRTYFVDGLRLDAGTVKYPFQTATVSMSGAAVQSSGNFFLDVNQTNDCSGVNFNLCSGLKFGYTSSGEGISSNRSLSSATNYNGLDLYTNNTARLSITNDGKVGIGTQAPTSLLHLAYAGVNSGTTGIPEIRLQNTDGTNRASQLVFSYGSGNTSAWQMGNDWEENGTQSFYMYDNVAGANRFYISSTGSINIGGTSPSAKLDVEGTIQMDIATNSGSEALCHTGDNAQADATLVSCSSTPLADYAEGYATADDVEFGDIVSVGTKVIYSKVGDGQGNVLPGALAEERQLVKSQVAYDSLAIGIVSNNYGDFTSTGLDLIDPADHPMPVALSGRVPVKISPSSEPIMAGDYVTTSSDPGKAMKAVGPGQTIGKALEDWTPGSGKTQIRVFVNMSQGNSFDLQQNPQGDIADGVQWQDDVLSLQGDITMSGNMNVGGNGMIHGNLTVTGTASIGELYVANAIVTGNLTVGGTITTGKLVVNHLVTAGDAPTIAAGAAACENPTVAIEGNDTAGMITVTTGQLAIGQVACGSGVLVQITFHEAFDAAPRVTLTAAEANAAGFTQVFVDSTTATGASFDLDSIIPPAPQKTYKWYYQAMQ